jgi:glycosyltransferase involved in cell wall biosynthesis
MYIALTEFARQRFVAGGLPAEKFVVKPNFAQPDPGMGEGKGDYLLFVGRLSQEKGLDTLLQAWGQLRNKVRLKIVGDGPLASKVAGVASQSQWVEWEGRQPKSQVLALMKNARALIFPSIWYEGFPMVIVEAYAVGLPVIASELGSMASLIDPSRTGLHFRAGDSRDLVDQVEYVVAHPARISGMRREARAEFESKYTAERNYGMLSEIYQTAMDRKRTQAGGG